MNDTKLNDNCVKIFKTETRRRRFCPSCEKVLYELKLKQKDYVKYINDNK